MRGETTSSLISSFTTMPDSLYNICCASVGQYRKNGVMLYKHNDTIVGKPLPPSSIKPIAIIHYLPLQNNNLKPDKLLYIKIL
tara:strand:+ start:121 stop:369 length:249 start_codon:yes stop_codon:yes gene_type:complete